MFLQLTTQSEFSSKFLPIWLPLYRVEQVLTNSNYIIRKVGTHFTQCVHRIRLRPVVPQYQIEDLVDVNPVNFRRDPMLGRFRSEPALFDEAVPTLLMPSDDLQAVPTQSEPLSPVRVTLSFPIAPTATLPAAPAAGPAIPPLPAVAAAPARPQSSDQADVIPAPSERRVTGEIIPEETSTRSSDASASHTATSPATGTTLLGSRSTRNTTDPNAAILRNTERALRLHREAKTTTLDSRPDCYRDTGGRATLPKTWMRAFASGDLTSAPPINEIFFFNRVAKHDLSLPPVNKVLPAFHVQHNSYVTLLYKQRGVHRVKRLVITLITRESHNPVHQLQVTCKQ